MTATKYDLYIEQGATFKLDFFWYQENAVTPDTPGDPYDLTGCTARMQIRTVQQGTLQLDATTENGKIVLGNTTGRITVVASAEDTAAMTKAKSAYDLEVVFAGTPPVVYRILEGSVTLSPNITQTVGEPVVS